jgi:hypothetical protein
MRKFQIAAVVAFSMVFFAGAQLARAQEVNKATVSFPFEVGGVVMPAGTYTITVDDMDPGLLRIQSENGQLSAFAIVMSEDTTARRGDCQFDFVRVGNRYYLSQIDNGTGDVQDLVVPTGSTLHVTHAKGSRLNPRNW